MAKKNNVLRDFLGLSDPDPKTKKDQAPTPDDGKQDDPKQGDAKPDDAGNDPKKADTGKSDKDAKKDSQKSDDPDVKQIHDDQVKKTSEVPDDAEGDGPNPDDEASPKKDEPIPDDPNQSTGPKSSKVNPATEQPAKEVREMSNPLEFYDTIRKNAYNYDHGQELDPSLRAWILSTIKDDPELIQEACFKALPDILAADQSKIADVKSILKQAAESTERFRVVYIKKDDNQEFQDRAGAEAAIEPLRAFGVEFKNAFVRAWREVKADGTLGAKVAKVKVLDYFKNYDGDRDKLQAQLCLSDEEVGKKKPQQQSGKKDGGKPKNDHK